jgi:CRP/FNR family transcriptional regulator, anaerobic regulatory protein
LEKLRNYFENIGFKDEDLNKILDAFILIEFKKGEFVVEEGKTSKYIGFIKSGMLYSRRWGRKNILCID